MKHPTIGLLVTLALFLPLAPRAADAQPTGRVLQVSILAAAPGLFSSLFDASRQGLRKLGWIEGQNIVVESRFAAGRHDRLPKLAAELVQLPVDLVVTHGKAAAQAAKHATATVPIVMAASGDPVQGGLVASLPGPGENITGLTLLSSKRSGKRLELLKEAVPGVAHVAVLWHPTNPTAARYLSEAEAAAQSLHVQFHPVEVAGPETIDAAVGAATQGQADALRTLPDAMSWHQRTHMADLAAKHWLPALFPERDFVDAGGLLSYGSNVLANFSRAAAYVDQILNGAQPGDLPVGQPMTFELVRNLKTAQAARTADAGNICHGWTLVGRGTKLLPAYPNFPFTEYWLWSAAQDKRSNPIAFRITGQFPYARFSSFQTYSPTQSPALLHADLIPDEGSVNPTRIGVNRYAESRSYTVWFVPAGSARAGQPNTLVMPADISAPNLILRILRPDKDKPHGGVPSPTVEAFDDRTGEPVACPRKTPPSGVYRPLPIRKLLAEIPAPQDPISLYRFTGERYVPNQEARFLAARLDFPYKRKIAALRFKVPTFPDTYSNPATVLTGKEETRYTGICVHGFIGTLTSECLADDELQKDGEGFANMIIGPENKALRHAAEARGYQYLSWKRVRVPLLAYRQVFPRDDFAGSIDKVPIYDPNLPGDKQRAEHFMGPYAPIGRVCSAQEFLAGSNCGLPKLSSSAQ